MRASGRAPIIRSVSEDRYHRIAEDLRPDWLDEWALGGIEQIEAYLANHAAFLAFLGDES
jgi:hypothetical protein